MTDATTDTSTTDAARSAASDTAGVAADQGKAVASTAGDEAKAVAGAASEQLSSVGGQAVDQARTARETASELQALCDGRPDEAGRTRDVGPGARRLPAGQRSSVDAPAVSATSASRRPMGLDSPVVVSDRVWCSASALISAPMITAAAEIMSHNMRTTTAPREP